MTLQYDDIYAAFVAAGYKVHRQPVERTAPGEIVMVWDDFDLEFECSDGMDATYILHCFASVGWNADDPNVAPSSVIAVISILHQFTSDPTFKFDPKPRIEFIGTSYRISIQMDWKQYFSTSAFVQQ